MTTAPFQCLRFLLKSLMGDRLASDRITQGLHLRLQETSKPEEITETRAELKARVQSLRKEVD